MWLFFTPRGPCGPGPGPRGAPAGRGGGGSKKEGKTAPGAQEPKRPGGRGTPPATIPATTAAVVTGIVAGVILLPIILAASGATGAFFHSYWTLAYLRLTGHREEGGPAQASAVA